ncbi:MAG TPA: autotransporter domain-containing protein [Stellaceae bacterium]|nr:autotransporter domain-containing protein [Stellaceae bacterium]
MLPTGAAYGQAAGPTVTQITQAVNEGTGTSAFSVAGAFQGNGCFVASPGPDVTVNGNATTALDGGTLTAGAAGTNVTYASNQGLTFGSFPVTLAFNYQCAVGGPVAQINDPNGLTLTIPQFTPAPPPVVVQENSAGTVISAAGLGQQRNYNTVNVITGPAHGSLTFGATPNQTVTYKPNANTVGADSFTYTLSQPGAATGANYTSGQATLRITVNQILPVATADTVTVPPNVGTPINVTANDLNGPFTSVTVVTQPAHGTAVANGLTVTYTPNAGYSGQDLFTYSVANTVGRSAPAPVSVTVTGAAPTSPPLSVTTTAGHAVTFDATAQATGAPFTGLAIATKPAHGSATAALPDITYTPAAGFSGNDTLTFILSNSTGRSAPITANITVTAGQVPVPRAIAISTFADTPVTVNVTAGATGGPFTSVAIVQPPPAAQGTARVQGLTIVFSPASGFIGTSTMLFTISNAAGASAPTLLSVTVAGQAPNANPSVSALLENQLDITRRFYEVQLKNFERHLEDLHHGAHGFSISLSSLGFGGGGVPPSNQPPNPGGSTSGDSQTPQAQASLGGSRRTATVGFLANGDSSGGSAGASSDNGAPADSATAPGTGDAGQTPPATANPVPPSSGDTGEDELPDRLGIFFSPIGSFGDRSAEFNHSGFDFSTVGFSLGGDYRLNDWAVAGIGGGFTHDNDTIGNDGSTDVAHSFNITAYGTIQATDQLYFDGIVTWANLNFDSKRLATTSGLYAYGNRDGEEIYGAVTGGYEFDDGALSLAPYIRLNLASATLDPFVEHGAGTASLTIGHETLTDFSTVIGFRGDYAISMEDGILSPHFRLEYLHEFLGASHTNLDFADQPLGPFFKYGSDPTDRNNFTLGAGASWLTENALSISFDYEALLAYRSETNNTFTLSITRRF